jgi:hypothetical protein
VRKTFWKGVNIRRWKKKNEVDEVDEGETRRGKGMVEVEMISS